MTDYSDFNLDTRTYNTDINYEYDYNIRGTSSSCSEYLTNTERAYELGYESGYSACESKSAKIIDNAEELKNLLEPIIDCGLLDECIPETVKRIQELLKLI